MLSPTGAIVKRVIELMTYKPSNPPELFVVRLAQWSASEIRRFYRYETIGEGTITPALLTSLCHSRAAYSIA